MGSVLCCLSINDDEEDAHPAASICRCCFCLSCFSQQFLNVYTALFQRGEGLVSPSSERGRTPSTFDSSIQDDSICNTYRAPPRPLPYDDPRCSPRQRDGVMSRHGKASRHSREESLPLRSNNDIGTESLGWAERWNGSNFEGGSKTCYAEVAGGVTYMYSSSEEEDVCPICLEEYTFENPRIIMQCTHHFHLSCIYEWMERSEACPVCGKVMVFNETT